MMIKEIGAIAQTGERAGKYIGSLIEKEEYVLEFGAGKGAITKHIKGKVTTVDLRDLPNMHAYTQVTGYSAQEYMEHVDIESFDVIVCSIPVHLMSKEEQASFMRQIRTCKHKDTKLIFLNYFKVPQIYSTFFKKHRPDKWIMKNLPPCVITQWV